MRHVRERRRRWTPACRRRLGLRRRVEAVQRLPRPRQARHGAQRRPAAHRRQPRDVRGARRRRAGDRARRPRRCRWRRSTSSSDDAPRSRHAALLALLQISDSLFPSGGFAHSYGLEQLVREGIVRDAGGLEALRALRGRAERRHRRRASPPARAWRAAARTATSTRSSRPTARSAHRRPPRSCARAALRDGTAPGRGDGGLHLDVGRAALPTPPALARRPRPSACSPWPSASSAPRSASRPRTSRRRMLQSAAIALLQAAMRLLPRLAPRRAGDPARGCGRWIACALRRPGLARRTRRCTLSALPPAAGNRLDAPRPGRRRACSRADATWSRQPGESGNRRNRRHPTGTIRSLPLASECARMPDMPYAARSSKDERTLLASTPCLVNEEALMRPVLKVGVGGPVGSGKTALVETPRAAAARRRALPLRRRQRHLHARGRIDPAPRPRRRAAGRAHRRRRDGRLPPHGRARGPDGQPRAPSRT